MTAKLFPGPGRPRGFDLEEALNLGQVMFHARGYEAVGVAALTDALGIKPPSFYKAFGSKAAYFEQILNRYSQSVLALEDILLPERPAGEALADLIERAARTYAQNPEQRGCLVLECARGCSDDESVILARRTAEQRRGQVRAFVNLSNPQASTAVTDYVASVMSGLSASAREGMSEDRLLGIARAAATGVRSLLNERS